jgi:hypothetical protein
MTEVMIGSFNERGYLAGFTRRGFTPERSIQELVANALDAIERGNVQDGFIHFLIGQYLTKMIDNGCGMTREQIRWMFDNYRENHANDKSRGVSGIGAKPALSCLSNKKDMCIKTHSHNGEYLRADIPWSRIHAEGRFTGMISVRNMTDEEIAEFRAYLPDTGTSIEFPTNDTLRDTIRKSFVEPIDEVAPLDRMGIVYGMTPTPVAIEYIDIDDPTTTHPAPLYNYFGAPQTDFYWGKSEDTIRMYQKDDAARFIWEDDDSRLEISETRRGGRPAFDKEPGEVRTGLAGWHEVGQITVATGLRRDPAIFDVDHPVMPDAAEKRDAYSAGILGSSDAHRDFMADNKVVRNFQIIGSFPTPDVKSSSARANGEAYLFHQLLQTYVMFNPVSSHNNRLDKAFGIQENKNQFDGSAIPITLSRLIRAIRNKKAKAIYAQMQDMCNRAAAVSPTSDVSSETTSTVSTPVDSPASIKPLSSKNIIDQMIDLSLATYNPDRVVHTEQNVEDLVPSPTVYVSDHSPSIPATITGAALLDILRSHIDPAAEYDPSVLGQIQEILTAAV